MKKTLVLTMLLALAVPSLLPAQGTQVSSPTGKTLAATMNVYVFPSKGQAADQQSQDEAECYNWAVQNVGTDPFELSKQAQQQQQQTEQAMAQAQEAGKGSAGRSAVRGAAAGALIGEIASDDPGAGAAYGAAAGLIRGRRKGKQAQKQAEAQVEAQAASAKQATQEQLDNFKKAFSVCLEAKDYMVKY